MDAAFGFSGACNLPLTFSTRLVLYVMGTGAFLGFFGTLAGAVSAPRGRTEVKALCIAMPVIHAASLASVEAWVGLALRALMRLRCRCTS